jgi:hypothetical protein
MRELRGHLVRAGSGKMIKQCVICWKDFVALPHNKKDRPKLARSSLSLTCAEPFCIRKNQTLKARAWATANPEKVKRSKRQSYQKNAVNICAAARAKRRSNPNYNKYQHELRARDPERYRIYKKTSRPREREQRNQRAKKITDLLIVLRAEMPDLLERFGL